MNFPSLTFLQETVPLMSVLTQHEYQRNPLDPNFPFTKVPAAIILGTPQIKRFNQNLLTRVAQSDPTNHYPEIFRITYKDQFLQKSDNRWGRFTFTIQEPLGNCTCKL